MARLYPITSFILTAFISMSLVACGGQGADSPVAAFTATPTEGTAPLAVSFDASGSHANNGSTLSYAWDFGDGQPGSGITTRYTYSTGSYTATLSVTDSEGKTQRTSKQIVATNGGASGSIAGSLRFGADASVARNNAASEMVDGQAFVPGEVIVGFEPSLRPQALGSLSVAGLRLESLRSFTSTSLFKVQSQQPE